MVTGKPSAYLLKDKMLVQLTSQYHIPFELSLSDAFVLMKELKAQMTRYAVQRDKNPWCVCGTRKAYHDHGVGACGKGVVDEENFGAWHEDNTCKQFRLDPDSHKKYEYGYVLDRYMKNI